MIEVSGYIIYSNGFLNEMEHSRLLDIFDNDHRPDSLVFIGN